MAFGNAKRLPLVPPASSTAPPLAASPTQYVATGQREDLHRVVDRHRRGDAAAGRIDIEVDVLAAILALQVQQLHDHFVRIAIVDFALQQDDPIFQQQIAEGQLPLPLIVAVGQLRVDRRQTRITHARFL